MQKREMWKRKRMEGLVVDDAAQGWGGKRRWEIEDEDEDGDGDEVKVERS